MLRHGRSDTLNQTEDNFTTTLFLSVYRHPILPDTVRVFVAFDLQTRVPDEIHLLAGRCEHAPTSNSAPRDLAAALRHETPSSNDSAELAYQATDGSTRWIYDRRSWHPGLAAEDIEWTVTRLDAAVPVSSRGLTSKRRTTAVDLAGTCG